MAGGTEVGKIYYSLDLDDTALTKGIANSESAVDSFGSKLLSIGKRTAAALGVAGAAATAFALKSAADFEQTRIGLENMLGGADKARAVLKEVSQFAAQTPFEFPELADSVRQLIAFGFSGSDAIATMKQLGDVSAAVGAPIGDLSYLMGTLRTQGRAMTVDIRQFAQRGIPIYEYLGKVLGKSTQQINDMIEAGKIGFPEVQKAFQAMTAEGGQFHGTMAKQSKSLSGLWSTLKDNISQTGRELIGINQEGDVAQGSVFDRLRNGISGLITVLPSVIAWLGKTGDMIKGIFLPPLTELWLTVRDRLMPALTRLWQEVLKPLAPVIGTLLVGALILAINALTGFLQILTPVINFIIDNKWAVLALATAFGVLKAAMMFDDVFNAITIGFNVFKLVTIPSAMASMTAFKVLVTSPMIMPAIEIGAALVALGAVYDAAQKTKAAVQGALDAKVSASDQGAAIGAINQKFKAGQISATQRDNAIGALLKGVDSLKYARGTSFAKGGLSLVGEHGPELMNVPRGSQVLPTGKTKEMIAGSGGVTLNMYGDNHFNDRSDMDYFIDKLNRKMQLSQQGMTA